MDPSTFNTDEMIRLLDSVRDTNRIEIIYLLGKNNSMNVGDIAAHFQISRPAVSHHLKVLKDASIVQNEKIGQEIYYRLDRKVLVDRLRKLADAFENCCKSTSAGE